MSEADLKPESVRGEATRFFREHDLERDDLVLTDDLVLREAESNNLCTPPFVWFGLSMGIGECEEQLPNPFADGPVITVPRGSGLAFHGWNSGYDWEVQREFGSSALLRVTDGPWAGLIIAVQHTFSADRLAEIAKIRPREPGTATPAGSRRTRPVHLHGDDLGLLFPYGGLRHEAVARLPSASDLGPQGDVVLAFLERVGRMTAARVELAAATFEGMFRSPGLDRLHRNEAWSRSIDEVAQAAWNAGREDCVRTAFRAGWRIADARLDWSVHRYVLTEASYSAGYAAAALVVGDMVPDDVLELNLWGWTGTPTDSLPRPATR